MTKKNRVVFPPIEEAHNINATETSWVFSQWGPIVDVVPPDDRRRWLFTISGIAEINYSGNSDSSWRTGIFHLHFNMQEPLRAAHYAAYHSYPADNKVLVLEVEQASHFVALNSTINDGQSTYSGFSINSSLELLDLNRHFQGLQAVATVRGTDACLSKVSFQVTLVGTIIEEDLHFEPPDKPIKPIGRPSIS